MRPHLTALPQGTCGRLLADNLATGLIANSVTNARALHHRHSRSKLLPLNPSVLNGNDARRGRGVSGAAGISFSRTLLWWIRLRRTAQVCNRRDALPMGALGLCCPPKRGPCQSTDGCANRTTHQPAGERTCDGPSRQSLLGRGKARRGQRQAKRDSGNLQCTHLFSPVTSSEGWRTADQFAWAVRVRRCAVHRPEQPSDDTAHEPEPDVPDSLPEAMPWTPLFCKARLTDPLDPT